MTEEHKNAPPIPTLDGLPRWVAPVAALGGLALLAGGFAHSHAAGEAAVGRFFQAYFVAFCFFLTLSLGALFFVLLHHVTHAGWSVVVRRLAEVLAVDAIAVAALFVPIAVWGVPHVFPWAGKERLLEIPAATEAYLRPPFLLARCALYLAVWIMLAVVLWRRSLAQDFSGRPEPTLRNERLSGWGMIAYGVTVTFAGIDLVMGLNPHWGSTVFGVYFFAGCAVAIFAALPLICMALARSGRLDREVTVEHYHEMGKLLFAFVFFWSYIAYSQYMLIWYANLPEETDWFAKRAGPASGPWYWVSVALVLGHWALPFAALLSRAAKRVKALLAMWAVWMLAMHYLDLYWMVMPEFGAGRVSFGAADAVCLVGAGAIYAAGALWIAGRRSLLAVRDPRLAESLALESL